MNYLKIIGQYFHADHEFGVFNLIYWTRSFIYYRCWVLLVEQSLVLVYELSDWKWMVSLVDGVIVGNELSTS